ncbi:MULTISPECIES: sugar phosphate isomerase/epimerase family protein [Virgibacillus]|uniref:Xylose isomerase-like TIM barrel domain-containing protein n=1 Tax=Virgibacillus pantothenticus TaxID=1473 RepID=A0A0L0QPZ9_VIRPA|nr:MULTISPECIES: sugar phosphate isomerase/epimerase [Virgibacillus]API90722.1 hypothetical protein BKP57_01895 [Virgibacillus sp. 6R]KNE20672.1 hypothetical protein AFK71_20220 [Virgibacillus pantothenticus]MBS7427678.1 sugar phosphate isomerase/epimerase [Virgibacillus sp. 19R1-5]MED3739288.1 sugar phosphate isomerase/epimerase [Virgibacillus pantothenticus]QTY17569.1 sugar phosphate isomerase/epimerase [Virgibacillus pantothenticus]
MAYKCGVSGSTILTDPSKLEELFCYDFVDHIEIGEFPNQVAFEEFITIKNKHGLSFGLHSPLYRKGSKYDLLQHVHMEPEAAWIQFDKELKKMSELGAEYVLVHFPYFKAENKENTFAKIESGLARLHALQGKYNISIVCEPKLGLNRSAVNIELLHRFPVERWAKYNVKLCIDIGDYLLGTKEKTLSYISKWKDHIKVVHLHNVECKDGNYYWIPIHPTYEKDGEYYKVKKIIEELARIEDIIFVLEHTPHSNPSRKFVQEGINWLHHLVKEKQ